MSDEILGRDGKPRAAYLVHGEDASLVAEELSSVLDSLIESGTVTHDAIEEYGEPGQPDDLDVGAVLNACSTPPFLTERRVVVVRDASGFDAAAQRAIAAYLESPLDSTVLLLAQTSRVGAAVSKAVAAAGLVVRAQPGGGRARIQWITEHLHDSTLRFDAPAGALLVEHLGEDLARLEGIVQTLLATYGPNATIRPAELEPFLGEAGSVAPWDLTDAVDEGDTASAIRGLHRMMEAGDRHPLQLLAILHRHYGAMLRLDGAEIADEAAASVATGLAPFPAKKVLRQSRRLGHDRVTRAIELLAAADLDLRGQIAWPEALVMEVLVARLAQLVRLAQPAGAQRARAPPIGLRMSTDDLAAMAALAELAATRAGELLASYVPRRAELALGARSKSSLTDLVSAADVESERIVLDVILGARPDDGVLAEEGSDRTGTSGVTWVIDPLDGTTNFLYGSSSFAVSIAAVRDGTALVGVVHDPVRNETFTAAHGLGATLNGAPFPHPAAPSLGVALVGTGFGYRTEQRRQQALLLPTLLPGVRDIRRSGSAALDLCAVAAGRLDAYYEAGLAPWDRAAGLLIAKEAGCSSVELDGLVEDLPTLVVARTPLLGELVDLLGEASKPLPR